MHRLGLAILGRGFLEKRRYRNLLRVGSGTGGLVLELFGRTTLLVPWDLVRSDVAPWGIIPQERWLLGKEQIPLTVRRGTVQPPR